MAANTTPKTLQQAIRYYSNLDVCQDALVEARWPDGVECPHCGSKDVRYLANQRRWECKTKHPRRQFSVKVGTIFEDSPIGLDKWFTAIWLIASAKNGISSYEIHRAIGVTQKSAWFMLHRIRLAMQTKSFQKMSGDVEIDETYIGGKARYANKKAMKGRYPMKGRATGLAGKTVLMGLLERRGGQSIVRTMVVPNNKRGALVPHVDQHVEVGSNVYTDALRSYDVLGADYVHGVVDHAETYVDGNVHTNGLENFWSLLKRTIKGTYVLVEPFHLFRYLDKQAFRFNTRKDSDGVRFTEMLGRIVSRRLTYAQLTGETATA
jgi:transposase-like protein